ncbi:von Willebrand factor type A domain-containing protein [Fomitopsis serialis]|uniref:von Willebrand factor type A domain-containing protein n=1 Tax=Fomitopsis serialis TaxID=139415 RepID=UPI002007A347|nr:von Willebrand factor type A domain-containing protein [Neoantrodia serialis]KAH9924780.1 von Willebrand factor type A domain-containing protein [Neoantrodia serialis]
MPPIVNTRKDSPLNGLITTRAGQSVYLPLVSVHAQVYIADTSARVALSQRFDATEASSGGSLTAVRYIFPIPASAAVCAFELKAAGRRLVGKVKELKAARKEFDVAVSQGELAGLLAEASADVFVLSIGAIPVRQNVQVKVTYVTELVDDALFGTLRFAFPTYFGQRYGTTPTIATKSASSASELAAFTLTAELQMTSPIEDISSPSHNDASLKTSISADATSAKVELAASADARLDRDFVLSIRASGLNTPRCVAEYLRDRSSVALSMTLVPRFGVSPLAEQEYVFLVDRSGSMKKEKRIDFAREAMSILLQSLPSDGTCFNIISFGSRFSALWSSSQTYTPDTLAVAEKHVDGMQPNFGGTKIEAALESIYQSRRTQIPTSVIILTDGDIWNAKKVLSSSRAAVAAASRTNSETYLRVFTLGIGDGASTEMCEGLARVGNGICYMTTEGEQIAPKCKALLDASSVPPSGNLTNLRVDWGYVAKTSRPTQPQAASSFFDQGFDPSASSRPTGVRIPVQQAPSDVPSLYVNSRFIVSAILSDTDILPSSVTLIGDSPDGQTVRLPVPVRQVSVDPGTAPLVHTLAARRLIQEIGDGDYQSLGVKDAQRSQALAARVEAAIVRLSEEYQLTSEFAAFVAVEQDPPKEDSDEVKGSDGSDDGDTDDDDGDDDDYYDNEDNTYWGNISGTQRMARVARLATFAAPSTLTTLAAPSTLRAEFRPARVASLATSPRVGPIRGGFTMMPGQTEAFSKMPTPVHRTSSGPSAVSLNHPVTLLAQLQAFDGSFKLDGTLISVIFKERVSLDSVKHTIPSSLASNATAETIWVTAIVAAYMKVQLADMADMWDVLWAKAMRFVVRAVVGGASVFEKLVAEAADIL